MKLARGLKMVRSLPRWRISLSCFASIDSRRSSSLMFNSDTWGLAPGSVMPAIWRLRQTFSAFGAVV